MRPRHAARPLPSGEGVQGGPAVGLEGAHGGLRGPGETGAHDGVRGEGDEGRQRLPEETLERGEVREVEVHAAAGRGTAVGVEEGTAPAGGLVQHGGDLDLDVREGEDGKSGAPDRSDLGIREEARRGEDAEARAGSAALQRSQGP